MQRNPERPEQRDSGEDILEERLLDEGQTSREDVVSAAQDAFERDQEDPDHPTRRERAHGVEDPSHSKGSTRKGAGERDL